ncbi:MULTISPECIES: hypothetical protein [Bacillaceae]|uniref:Uncharacterized protein n=1 Tax=Evansella alkalicola TaxID=745819 RepID=A0ABS6K130_9BACI|nr:MULTISPECIES: hypothetical protein [Bacillaceae]MBU9724147.1 hypothetical protein [Bacillus alkalicola]
MANYNLPPMLKQYIEKNFTEEIINYKAHKHNLSEIQELLNWMKNDTNINTVHMQKQLDFTIRNMKRLG